MLDIKITGAQVFHEGDFRPMDIFIKDGRIAALSETHSTTDDQTIQARTTVTQSSDVLVLPGIVDCHAHFKTWSGHRDDFEGMTRSAAHGGVTAVLGMVTGLNGSGLTVLQRAKQVVSDAAARDIPIDYGFHIALGDDPQTLLELDSLLDMGFRSFKMFMAYRDRGMMVSEGFLFAAMRRIAEAGGIAVVHAEAGGLIEVLEGDERSGSNGRVGYLRSRPNWSESYAIRRAIELADVTGCRLYVVHVSTAEGIEEIRKARASGLPVYAETCPHYLILSSEGTKNMGGLAKIAPPIRSEADRKALLECVLGGAVDVIASDHCPYLRSEKSETPGRDYWSLPAGAPGIETLLPMTWTGLVTSGLRPADIARMLSTNPAEIFGMPRKGKIALGADADLTIVRVNHSQLDERQQHSGADYSLYHGMDIPVEVIASYVRGELVLANGVVRQGGGEFVPRV